MLRKLENKKMTNNESHKFIIRNEMKAQLYIYNIKRLKRKKIYEQN